MVLHVLIFEYVSILCTWHLEYWANLRSDSDVFWNKIKSPWFFIDLLEF
jgi:hypothetical protein